MSARILVVHLRRPNDYVEAVKAAGAEPVVVDWLAPPATDLLARADGVLLTGGADVAPMLYGEREHQTYEAADAGRDGFETEVIRLALEHDLPVLAICRGMQILNVAAGGSLWQDVPSQLNSTIPHQVGQPRDGHAHDVAIDEESLLARLLQTAPAGSRLDNPQARRAGGGPIIEVNSRHHQAVKRVAPGFTATATASDGVIEAFERPASRFCVGVQWHPENFRRTNEFAWLFDGFVAAARQARPL